MIDTSSSILYVGLAKNGEIINEIIELDTKNHSIAVMPAIKTVLNGVKPDQIIVAAGPGSYTGLRIGVVTAKTLAYAYGVPLYAVSSLEVVAASYAKEGELVASVQDARRGNVYATLYQDGKVIAPDALVERASLPENARVLENLAPKGAAFLKLAKEPVENVLTFEPRYLKLVEAEEKWLENNTGTGDYVTRK